MDRTSSEPDSHDELVELLRVEGRRHQRQRPCSEQDPPRGQRHVNKSVLHTFSDLYRPSPYQFRNNDRGTLGFCSQKPHPYF